MTGKKWRSKTFIRLMLCLCQWWYINRILGEKDIKVVALPTNTTNIFEALDLALFGVFKSTVDQSKQAFLSKKKKKNNKCRWRYHYRLMN